MTWRGCIVLGVMAGSCLLSAQQQQSADPPQTSAPLGDVARAAEAARVTAKKARKTYTNADLSADPRGEAAPAAPPPAGFMSASLGRVVTPEEMVTRSQEKVDLETGALQPEEHWRGRAESIRGQVDKLAIRREAMSRPNPERDANPVAKSRDAAELAKVQQGIDGLKKQWDRLEESARVAKVKPEWLDPRPKF